jgi:hypothetical protein
MYSAKSFELTKDEFNYLLPVLRNKLIQSDDKYYIISNDINDLSDIINRLKGVYNPLFELNAMVVYKCSTLNNISFFRDTVNNITI